MRRTLINLDPDDKAWLDREARRRRVPMTELVRQAVHRFRNQESGRRKLDMQAALVQTAGIWRHGEALAWQERMRDEWQRSD